MPHIRANSGSQGPFLERGECFALELLRVPAKLPITACIIAHNDERYLPRCLSSVSQIAEEIVLVHDGPCRDRSLQIAAEFGARVFERAFEGSSESHRAFSFEQAKGQWVMRIDPDEFLPPATIEALPALLQRPDIDAYAFRWPSLIRNGYVPRGPFSRNIMPCLFRKEKMWFLGVTHLSPNTYGRLEIRRDLLLEHRPDYENWTLATFQRKFIPWSRIEANQLRNFESAPSFQMRPDHPALERCRRRRDRPIFSCLDEVGGCLWAMLKDGLLWAGPDNWRMACVRLARIASVYCFLLDKAKEPSPSAPSTG